MVMATVVKFPRQTMRQSVGVCGVKHLIRWCYPHAVAAFDDCAAEHDRAYKQVDWAESDPTGQIDSVLLYCMLIAAGEDQKLMRQAWLFYRVARGWAKMRKALWRVGLNY